MSENKFVDYLIIGQGIAGSLLSWFLINKGKSVLVLDDSYQASSSRVAAGLVHPITGRRIVLTWMADELIPFADKTYADLEKDLSKKFYFHKDAFEIVTTAGQWNDWNARMEDPALKKYIGTTTAGPEYSNAITGSPRFIPIRGTRVLDTNSFLESYQSWLKKSNSFVETKFDPIDLVIKNEQIEYLGISARRIIFCEGIRAQNNPLWNWVPFKPAKGELLTIESKDLPEDYILFKSIYIIPLGSHKFRVGATNSWGYDDDQPTDSAKEEIIESLNNLLKVPFKILDHKAGIRPTVPDRRPLIGVHPEYKNAFFFNGLGTKGVSLGPYFADQFSEMLESGKSLIKEVNLERFYK